MMTWLKWHSSCSTSTSTVLKKKKKGQAKAFPPQTSMQKQYALEKLCTIFFYAVQTRLAAGPEALCSTADCAPAATKTGASKCFIVDSYESMYKRG